MSARDVAFTLMALGHVAGCRGKSDAEILAEAVGEIVRLQTLNDSVMAERHEMHDRLMTRIESIEAERDRYKGALEIIAALVLSYDIPPMWEARTIACEALNKEV